MILNLGCISSQVSFECVSDDEYNLIIGLSYINNSLGTATILLKGIIISK